MIKNGQNLNLMNYSMQNKSDDSQSAINLPFFDKVYTSSFLMISSEKSHFFVEKRKKSTKNGEKRDFI